MSDTMSLALGWKEELTAMQQQLDEGVPLTEEQVARSRSICAEVLLAFLEQDAKAAH